MVATALNNPLAILSVSSSMSWSEELGELRIVYDVVGSDGVGGAADPVPGTEGLGGDKRENRDAEGVMKERYWSAIWPRMRI